MLQRFFLATSALTIFCVSAVFAEDWPEFRGPTGQGIVASGKLPIEWSPTKNIVWKQAIPGLGWSSPVIHDGQVYLTSAVPIAGAAENDRSLQAICLEATSGKLLWQTDINRQEGAKAPKIHSKNSHASPTPLIQDGKMYVHFGHYGTACLDLAGKIVWKNTDLKYEPVHGNGGSPIIVDNALIFSGDGRDKPFVAALDRQTGALLWKTPRNFETEKYFSFCTPLLIAVNGQKQVVLPASGGVAAYNPQTGQEIWRVNYKGYSVIPRPVYGHGLLYICTGYDAPVLLAIRPDGQGDVTKTHVAWSMKKAVPHTPSLLLVGDELYMVSDNGFASCVDAKTGTLHWQQRIGGNYSSSLIFADGKIYFQSEQGTGLVIKASKEFEQLAKNDLNERSLASYAAADGALYIRTDKHLYRVQER